MKIKYFEVKITQEKVDDLIRIHWECYDGIKIVANEKIFSGSEVILRNDFKSVWDHIWDRAKFLIEVEFLDRGKP